VLKRALEFDFMELDCIHFCVGDATQTLDLLVTQMGLQNLGNRTNEHTIEYLVGNAHLLFAIVSPLTAASPAAEYLKYHPSGVRDVSFRVPDLDKIRRTIARLGIRIIANSNSIDDIKWLKIQGWGAIEHTITQAAPNSIGSTSSQCPEPILGIDHIVLNVNAGDLEPAVNWYRDLFDFQVQQTFDIQTQKSGLTSQALVSSCGQIRFNINEPSSTNSQIQEFLDLNHGAGIQHIALQTCDILTTIARMQQQDLAFLPIPQTY
jgi:4-hydroxyphenylpyruvate dioxygenase